MLMAVTAAMPMMMAKAIVGMPSVMRCLRNLIGRFVVDRLGLLCLDDLVCTRRCLRKLIGTFVVACLGLLCLDYLDYLVLFRCSVWLTTRHIRFLPGDNAFRNS